MRADGRGAHHRDAQLAALLPGFHIQVIQHFDVVGQKTNRQHGDVAHAP